MASTTSTPPVDVSSDSQQQIPAQPIPTEPLPQDDELQADNDSTYESISGESTSSLNSSVVRGYIENGRRYQTVREGQGQYFVPADEKQFESIQAGHLAFVILESQQMNPLFRSPINEETVQNILDLGTGDGAWAIDVADRYPQATVRGIDLSPPPQEWVPPNCILELDDMTKEWTYKTKFDLIHLRQIFGSFSYGHWDALYARIYENLEPGGWIEQLEMNPKVECDDGSAPADAPVLGTYEIIRDAAEASGNPVTVFDQMKGRIEKAGFVNIHVKTLKMPYGNWPMHPVYKDVGRCNKIHYLAGVEGWTMWLLTKFGKPEPWSVEQVQLYLMQLRADMNNPQYHLYQQVRRVWAQKPYDSKVKDE